MIKKLISFLSLTAILFAAEAPDFTNSCYTSTLNPYTQSGYGGQCTAFAWGRACEKDNIQLEFNTQSYPSAKYWYQYQPISALNLTLGATPRPHAIAVWGGDAINPHGHVAYVENVQDGRIYFNEANINTYTDTNYGGGYDGYEKNLPIANFTNRGGAIGTLLGYIYLDDVTVEEISISPSQSTFEASCDQTSKLLSAGFKLINRSAASIYLDAYALALHDENNKFITDIGLYNFDNKELRSNYFLPFPSNDASITTPGNYKLVAKAHYGDEWHELNTLDIVVTENKTCQDTAEPTQEEMIETTFAYLERLLMQKVSTLFHVRTKSYQYASGTKITYRYYADQKMLLWTKGDNIYLSLNQNGTLGKHDLGTLDYVYGYAID